MGWGEPVQQLWDAAAALPPPAALAAGEKGNEVLFVPSEGSQDGADGLSHP